MIARSSCKHLMDEYMDNKLKFRKRFPLLIASMVLAGCASTPEEQASVNNVPQTKEEVQQVVKAETEATDNKEQTHSHNNDLLPPTAKAGECYARVWKEPAYKTINERMLVKEEGKKLTVTPAKYVTSEERVMLTPESKKVIPKPAVYKTVKEKVLVKEAGTTWRTKAAQSAPLAPKDIVERASKHGIDLAAAKPNQCFHEHSVAKDYTTKQEKVLVKEKSEKIITKPATYRTVEKKVLVKEASSKIVVVPAVYETVEEKVIDKPAHQVWKKGTGAIQKINESTGEIMCLVDVPATYKTVTKQVLKTPETTKVVKIPAEYTTVKVKELVTAATEERVAVPAEYKNVTKTELLGEQRYVWHEISNNEMSKKSRTGNQICLVDSPAEYKTVTKRVVTSPATTETVTIPATYKTVKVQKLAQKADTQTTVVPAEYKIVQRKEKVEEGKMEWRSILCETNMTTNRISDIQRALLAKGYNPGKIDGIVGKNTMSAVNAFQKDNNLPVDDYLNIETVQALNVAVN